MSMTALAVTGLTGCSEDPGPARPGPSGGEDLAPPPAPDMPVLRATLTRTRASISASAAGEDPDSSRTMDATRTALQTQERVLTQLVQAGGDSSETTDMTSAPDSDAATSTGSGPSVDPAVLADVLLQSSLGEVIRQELSTVTGINLPTLMALHGQRVAAARLLGARVSLPALRGPSGAGAITVLAGLRQAVYGLEVLAARSEAGESETYRDALTTLRGPTRMVTALAGAAAPAPPLGYGLPTGLSTSPERREAAQQLLIALSQSVIAGSSARAFNDDAIGGTIALMAMSVEVGTTFNVPMAGFPGLSVPQAP